MKRAAIAYLLLVLTVGLLVTLVMTGESEHEKEEAKAETEHAEKAPKALPGEITPGPEIAKRVAAIRGGEFEEAPDVKVVPEEELTKKLTELDADPDDPRLANAAALLMTQAGAFDPKDAEQLAGRRHAGTGVLAAYVPEENAVLVDQELAESDPEVAELAAASELSRALDVAGAKEAPRVAPVLHDDEATRVALQSGAGVLVEREYAKEHLGGNVNAQAARESRRDPETPPAAETLARFPAAVGGLFMEGVERTAGWDGVDKVLGDPPTTTNALLHRQADEAVPPPRFSVRGQLGKGWKRLASANVGELDTAVLMRGGAGERLAFKSAAGWRAGRFEAWQKGTQTCPPPCRKSTVSVVVHRWGDVADATTFNRNMRDALIEATAATPEGGRGFTFSDDGGAALVRAGRFTALVFAPDAPLAGKIAERVLEG